MAAVPLLELVDVHVDSKRSGRPVSNAIHGLSVTIGTGEIHALICPDAGAGTALAAAVLGSPDHLVTAGSIRFRGDDISDWPTNVRAKAGVFLGVAERPALAGVSLLGLLGQAMDARGLTGGVSAVNAEVTRWAERLGLDHSTLDAGAGPLERADAELLQMAVLQPHLAVLGFADDEMDDDELAAVAAGIESIRVEQPKLGALTICRTDRFLRHLDPTGIQVMAEGRIIASGGPELANRLATNGYESFT